ncbi:transglutaminase-like domain-containing protein [Lutibacter sp.]|uniref:transglutaminase-like domain-containing protein n=1 Tax=Lutibacter sp. TaxID=1925666 RepID=UPI0025C1CF06|nr:transglutaminase-like domain-containing protein [Lutibacter sp.]MCF6181423.1 transglutaminase-like domain-containing protein [Lutibacter sp.]
MDYLNATYYFDYETDEIQKLIQKFKTDTLTQKEKAKQLYLKIRDNWRYNPYRISLSKENYKASVISKKTETHCIDKSILLIAGLRGLQIPAKIHLAKVKNHIGIERIIEKFGTDEISPHGMVDVFLDGKWLKASPAFNKELCLKCNVAPLDFDGESDSIFQEFDNKGNEFMEYLEDYGSFDDVPIDFIFKNFKENYPKIFEKYEGQKDIII